MKKLISITTIIFLSIISVFAIGPSKSSAKIQKTISSNEVVTPYDSIPEADRDAMICFMTFVMTAEDAEDWDDDGPFAMLSGKLKERSMNGIDVFEIQRNATFVSIVDRSEVFAENATGTFTYEDDYGLFSANMTAKFPSLDDKMHTFTWQTNASMQKNRYSMPLYNGAKVTVDAKTYNLDETGVALLSRDAHNLIGEYMRYAFL